MKIKECTKCKLHKTRTNVVVGGGNVKSDIMFIGEAPGKNEDLQSKPFVGKSGLVLNEMLDNIGLKRSNVYITNIVKCRPPDNRDPTGLEKIKCSMWLKKQIKIIKPKIIVTLGKHSYSSMYIIFDNIKKMKFYVGKMKTNNLYYVKNGKNNFYIYKAIHPAATLYNHSLIEILYTQFEEIKIFLQAQNEKK